MAFTPEAEPPESGSGLKFYWAGSAIVLVLAIGYLGWVFYSRWESNRAIEERMAAQKRAQAAEAFEGMGGSKFDILMFYANPGIVKRGEESTLCYGVSNAKTVALDPQADDPVWPSQERCVNVTPKKTTIYTLNATDAAGHSKSATATVEVR